MRRSIPSGHPTYPLILSVIPNHPLRILDGEIVLARFRIDGGAFIQYVEVIDTRAPQRLSGSVNMTPGCTNRKWGPYLCKRLQCASKISLATERLGATIQEVGLAADRAYACHYRANRQKGNDVCLPRGADLCLDEGIMGSLTETTLATKYKKQGSLQIKINLEE